MNEQKAPGMIEWTRIKNADGTVRRGYTWNPVAGCLHDCEWVMPDGNRAECYAKTVAEKFKQHYPQGFAHDYWHPERLSEPKRITEGAGIFSDSMSDLMGAWVAREHQEAVFQVMRETPQHIYQVLTKNAPRYAKYDGQFPANLWAGVSSPPDHMLGVDLNDNQKSRYLHKALDMLERMPAETITWMSFEPLSQDWAHIVAQYPAALSWAVIGAASNGRKEFPPDEAHVRNLIDVLDDQGCKVFFKGNLRSLPWAKANWREDFPSVPDANHSTGRYAEDSAQEAK